jgi:glucose-1-phosphate thymidylyltransferase
MPIKRQKQSIPYDLVGIIPAAGTASRLGPLPCSKELLPVGFQDEANRGGYRPKVVGQYLLERMRLANVSRVYIILRKGKWDIPSYFGDGKMLDLDIAYLMMGLPFGVPYTLDQAYPFIKALTVVFGFPDIIFQPKDAYLQLLNKLAETRADIVLGLFAAEQPSEMDMVELDRDQRVCGIQIKPSQTYLRYTWIIAVWTPAFTHFMHEWLLNRLKIEHQDQTGRLTPEHQELYVGDVIQVALENNIIVESVFFSDGSYSDIGTPEKLMTAVRVKAND